MAPATHFLIGWMVANLPGLNRRERASVAIAGVIPDVDGLGVIAEVATRNSARPLTWFSDYHHTLHNLTFALAISAVAFFLATRRWKTALLVFLSFHLHLLGDLVGARGPDGYQWPIPYLLPWSRAAELTWSGQWALNAWPNFLITGVLLAATLYLAWARGYSPLEIVSQRGDAALVATLRARFPNPQVKPRVYNP
jgi:inner membrane protein